MILMYLLEKAMNQDIDETFTITVEAMHIGHCGEMKRISIENKVDVEIT